MRTVLSLVFLTVLLWASCSVKLGRHTLAEHVDRIAGTEEAKELLDGTRGRISPALEDMKQRIFGEYVEAPTQAETGRPQSRSTRSRPSDAEERVAGPRGVAAKSRAPGEAARSRVKGAETRREDGRAPTAREPRPTALRGATTETTRRAGDPGDADAPRGASTAEAARLPGARR